MTRTRYKIEKDALSNAKARCQNQDHAHYRNYGGRGIRVASEFLDPISGFWAFLDEVGERPGPGYCLDRIDSNGHYEVGNLRWVDRKTSASNRRSQNSKVRDAGFGFELRHRGNGQLHKTPMLEHQGRRMSVPEWAAETGLSQPTIRQRIDRGWPMERVLDPILYSPRGGPRTNK